MTLTHSGRTLLLPLLVGVCACGRGEASREGQAGAAAAPMIVASIYPIGDLARFLGGDDVQVVVLLPPRASPSTFEPTARQMGRLSGAAGYLFIGGGMDHWAERLAGSGDLVVRLTDGIQLQEGHAHEGEPGTGNPHVWLDPVLVRDRLLPRIEEVLAQAAPGAAERIHTRRQALADSLTALDAWVRSTLADVRSRGFISTHSAWGYFAARYRLEEIGVVYESPGREPSSRHLAGLIAAARASGTRAVFIEPQLGEMGARTVAGELGVDVHLLDPNGDEEQEGRDGYLALMRFNTQQLARALGGGEAR